MNDAPAHPPALALTGPPPADEGWSRTRWLIVIAFILATHVALIVLFGQKKAPAPRAVVNVPALKLAEDSGEWLTLNDPTLFALPHQRDFASAVWLKLPEVKQPSFWWTEPPRWLSLPADELGATFDRFMQTNSFAGYPLNFKPVPQLNRPALPPEQNLAARSTMQIEGALAQRQLPNPINLTNWPYANIISPSVVQVLVNENGNVVSTVLLPPGDGFTVADQYDAADQRALEIARALRFTPAAQLTFGRIVFDWHTVPAPAAPTATPP